MIRGGSEDGRDIPVQRDIPQDIRSQVCFMARISCGASRSMILFFVHYLQACGAYHDISNRLTMWGNYPWKSVLDFFGVICQTSGLERILFSRVCFSVWIFSLVFCFHVGLRASVILLALLLVPVSLCAGLVPFLISLLAMCVVLFVCVHWNQSDGSRGLSDALLYPFRKMVWYCLFGGDGVRDRSRVSRWEPFGVVVYLFLSFAWIILVVSSFSLRHPWHKLLFAVSGTLFVVRFLRRLRVSRRDLRYLACSVYYFYAETSYAPVIYRLGSSTSNWRVFVLNAYLVVLCVVVPVVDKLVVTCHVRRLSNSLPEGEYCSAMENGNIRYGWLFSGVRQDRYWWPFAEHCARLLYFSLLVSGFDCASMLLSIVMFVAALSALPCMRPSTTFMAFADPALLIYMHRIVRGAGPEDWSDPTETWLWLRLLMAPWIPWLLSYLSFVGADWRYTRIYKAVLMDTNGVSAVSPEYEGVRRRRNLVGLSADVKVKSSDDLPLFMSEAAFVSSYEGPSHDIRGDIERISRAEEGLAKSISDCCTSSNDSIAKLHVSLGSDPYVFRDDVGDWDLPSKVLVERVEYDVGCFLRKLYAYLFPISLLFFGVCAVIVVL